MKKAIAIGVILVLVLSIAGVNFAQETDIQLTMVSSSRLKAALEATTLLLGDDDFPAQLEHPLIEGVTIFTEDHGSYALYRWDFDYNGWKTTTEVGVLQGDDNMSYETTYTSPEGITTLVQSYVALGDYILLPGYNEEFIAVMNFEINRDGLYVKSGWRYGSLSNTNGLAVSSDETTDVIIYEGMYATSIALFPNGQVLYLWEYVSRDMPSANPPFRTIQVPMTMGGVLDVQIPSFGLWFM